MLAAHRGRLSCLAASVVEGSHKLGSLKYYPDMASLLAMCHRGSTHTVSDWPIVQSTGTSSAAELPSNITTRRGGGASGLAANPTPPPCTVLSEV